MSGYVHVTYTLAGEAAKVSHVVTLPANYESSAQAYIAQSMDTPAEQVTVVGTQPTSRIPCQTTTHYATHVAAPCAPFGSGQCDGYCEEHGAECTCSCHNDWDLPGTVAEVKVWHDKANGLIPERNPA